MGPRTWVRAKQLVSQMKSWSNLKNRRPKNDGRTVQEQCFDSGVFAASELVRRLTGDEELALAVHEMCIWRQREHEAESATIKRN